MMPLIDTLLWINLIAFLSYIPIVCYLDVKYREVDPRMWIPMLAICIPIAVFMYLTNYWYPWYSFVISLVMCLIFYVAMYKEYIEGADFLFLIFISLFWVMSPLYGAHGLMQIPFYIYFAFTSAVTAIYILGYNILDGQEWGVVKMMSDYPRGFPYMLTISSAFLLSVILA